MVWFSLQQKISQRSPKVCFFFSFSLTEEKNSPHIFFFFFYLVKVGLVQILLQEGSEGTEYYFSSPCFIFEFPRGKKIFLSFLCLLEVSSKGNNFNNNNNYTPIFTVLFKVFYNRRIHEAYLQLRHKEVTQHHSEGECQSKSYNPDSHEPVLCFVCEPT